MHNTPPRSDDHDGRTPGDGSDQSSRGGSGAVAHAGEGRHESERGKVARPSSGERPDAAAIGIGTKVWVYAQNVRGSQQWFESSIESETARTWVVRNAGWRGALGGLPKSDPTRVSWKKSQWGFQGPARIVFTREEMERLDDEQRWVGCSWQIGDAVRHCNDADKLRRIAEIVGFVRPEAKR